MQNKKDAYLWFQISMRDLISVNDFNAVDNLMEKLASLFLLHSFLCHNEIEHFATDCMSQGNKISVSILCITQLQSAYC